MTKTKFSLKKDIINSRALFSFNSPVIRDEGSDYLLKDKSMHDSTGRKS